jgi:hypothetical protein
MAKESIGKVHCQACGELAEVREQKNGRAYVLCNDPMCGFQGFTRSAHADKHLRAKMIANTTPPAAAPHPGQGTGSAPANETKPKKGFFDDLIN